MNKQQILSIADKVFLSEGYSFDNYGVSYDENNVNWIVRFQDLKERAPEFAAQYEQLLKDKNYQAVEYNPDPNEVIGGTFFVFIDKDNGNVIGFVGGV